jgi:hypothetical protein
MYLTEFIYVFTLSSNKILHFQPISLVVAGIEPKAQFRFRSAVIFLFYTPLKII